MRCLAVDPQELLGVGDHPFLDGGDPARLDQQARAVAALGLDQADDLGTGWVVTDQAEEATAGTECPQVAQDVAGAAEHGGLALDLQHGNRRLRRDPIDTAVDEAVEHDVADHQDPDLADCGEQAGELIALAVGHGRSGQP